MAPPPSSYYLAASCRSCCARDPASVTPARRTSMYRLTWRSRREPLRLRGLRERSSTQSFCPREAAYGAGRPPSTGPERRSSSSCLRILLVRVRGAEVRFDDCEQLGAVNLHGTGFAARDYDVHVLTARLGGMSMSAEVRVAGLAGFLLAKVAAAGAGTSQRTGTTSRSFCCTTMSAVSLTPQPESLGQFADDIGELRTAIVDLQANFADVGAQGSRAHADQLVIDHPEVDRATAAADSVLAVGRFCPAIL
jgi:hypothetical protein